MLAHQVFRWTNLDFLAFLPLLPAAQQSRSRQSCAAENDSAPEKNSAIRNALVLTSIVHALIHLYLNRRIESHFTHERISEKGRVEFSVA